MKKMFKSFFLTIGISLSAYVVGCIIADIVGHGNLTFSDWQFTKSAVGIILIAAGFSVPSLVYESKRLPYWAKVLIHMGIGCAVMLAISFSMGWIPLHSGWKICILTVAVQLLLSFVIWFCISARNKKLAERMNQKIKEKQ